MSGKAAMKIKWAEVADQQSFDISCSFRNFSMTEAYCLKID